MDNNQTTPDKTDAEITDLWGMFTINSVNNQPGNCINVELLINGIPLKMTLDTGASVTIISAATWKEQLSSLKLRFSNMLLKTYTGEPLKLQGEAEEVTVCYKGKTVKLPLVVVKGDGPSLLGRNWLMKINLDWHEIKYVSTAFGELLQKCRTLFSDHNGRSTGKVCC